MHAFKVILLAFAVMVATPTANAAVVIINCFETEQDATWFVENLEKHDEAFHVSETQTRKLIENPKITFNQIYMILGDALIHKELHFDPNEQSELHAMTTHDMFHTHLTPAPIKMNKQGQYCSRVGSESHYYEYKWFLDAERNIIDSNTSITVSR